MAKVSHLNAPGVERFCILDPDHRVVQVTKANGRRRPEAIARQSPRTISR